MKMGYLWMLLASSSLWAAPPGMRSVYLNGIDISSVRNQSLSQVDIKVDEKGNLYIVAPQYEVQQESTFVPLGKQTNGQLSPVEHKRPAPLMRRDLPPSSDGDGLATPPQTRDTLPQTENTVNPEAETMPDGDKQGTRTPPDAKQSPPGPGTQVQ